ncbi:hypothetical protein JCM14469_11800 [Desulfatiferula olefinivorans]
MKQIVTVMCLLVASILTETARADQFVGTGSRWPVAQTKAIAGHPDLDVVFVGDGDTLNVFSKSDLTLSAHIRLSSISEGIRALLYDHDRHLLFAACGFSGIRVVNVQNPLAPLETPDASADHVYTTSAHYASVNRINAYDIALHGNYLFIADYSYGLRVLDVSVPDIPLEKGWQNLVSGEDIMTPMRIDLYAEGPNTNVHAVVLMNSNKLPLIARFPISGFDVTPLTIAAPDLTQMPSVIATGSLLVRDTMAYCTEASIHDLIICDVDPENDVVEPVFSQSTNPDYDPSGDDDTKQTLLLFFPRGFDKFNEYLFITTHGNYDPTGQSNYFGLNVVNVADPSAPRAISRYPLTGANSVMVETDSAYIMSIHEGLYKVDLTVDPDADPEVTITDPPGLSPSRTMVNAHGLWVQKDLGIVYIADNIAGAGGGLTLLRLKPQTADEEGETVITRYASPALPIHERFISTPGTAKAACINEWNSYAYVADGDAGIQVFEISNEGGPADPILVPGSNIGIASGDVIDVEPMGSLLVAATTDPDEDLWVVDVSAPTDIDNPAVYTPRPIDLSLGAETARGVTAYARGDALYAMVPAGAEGLVIVRLNPDDEHPDQLQIPPLPTQIVTIDGTDARGVFAKANHSGDYAALADGAGGVKLIRLFQDDAPLELDPVTAATIDTSAYGDAIDVAVFADSTDTHLYVLTDNPDRAILLYQVTDMEHPEFMGYAASYGRGSAILATEIIVPSSTSLTGQATIRGVMVADGPGGIAFRQVTNDGSSLSDRTWPDDGSSFCFVSQALSSPATGILLLTAALWAAAAFLFHRFSRGKDRTGRSL